MHENHVNIMVTDLTKNMGRRIRIHPEAPLRPRRSQRDSALMLASFNTRSMTFSKVPVMSWEDKLQKVLSRFQPMSQAAWL